MHIDAHKHGFVKFLQNSQYLDVAENVHEVLPNVLTFFDSYLPEQG